MTNPIDIIAAALHDSDPFGYIPDRLSGPTASAAIEALNDERIAAHAAQALAADTASRPDSPLHAANMTVAEFEHLARVVLRSVGGA